MSVLGRIFGVTTVLPDPLPVSYGGTGLTTSQCLGTLAVSASTTILAAASGTIYTLSGSPTITLPALSNASASAPMTFRFIKGDGVGTAVLKCAGTDAFNNGLTSVKLYQETVELISFGGVWLLSQRQRGWIPITYGLAFTSTQGSQVVTEGFGDLELSEIEIVVENLVFHTADTMIGRVTKGGAVKGSTTYSSQYLQNSSTSAATAGGNSATSQFGLTGISSIYAHHSLINVRDPNNVTGQSQPVQWRGGAGIVGTGLIHGIGFESTAAAIQAFTIQGAISTLFTSGIYRVRGFR